MLNVTSASANSAFILSEVAYGRWFSPLPGKTTIITRLVQGQINMTLYAYTIYLKSRNCEREDHFTKQLFEVVVVSSLILIQILSDFIHFVEMYILKVIFACSYLF